MEGRVGLKGNTKQIHLIGLHQVKEGNQRSPVNAESLKIK
jgi:hypothetical protein